MTSELGTFKHVEQLVAQNELITSDGFLRHCDQNHRLVYFKRDFIFRSGSFRNSKQEGFLRDFRAFKNKAVVVGHSDIPTNRITIEFMRAVGAKFVFGTNLFPIRNLSQNLPLGLTNDCDDSPMHRILGNPEHFHIASRSSSFVDDFSPNFYVNFTISNNSPKRSYVLKIINQLDSRFTITSSTPSFSDNGRIDYLRRLRMSNFTICPEGNGFDTHRLWETIYMGGVPIILSNPYINNLVSELPVVIVKEWDEIMDLSLLEKKWFEIKSNSWNFQKIRLSYWKHKLDSLSIS
jgi:hypothetical protein